MIPLIRSLLPPLLSLILLIMGCGLMNTFVSVRLDLEHFSTEVIGAVTASLYVGILLGSLWLDRWIGRIGHIRSFFLFAAISSCLVFLQSFWVDPVYWAIIRLGCGICIAGVYIVIESWLLMQSPEESRSVVLSIYLAVYYGALALGQFLINLAPIQSLFPFYITSALSVISIFPIAMQKLSEPKIEHHERMNILKAFRISPLGFLGGVISGILLGAIYGLVPVYAKEIGLSISYISFWMATIIFGGLVFQWPVGLWADKTDRHRVLCIISLATTVTALMIPFVGKIYWLLFFLGWCFGGASLTIYPLSMAYVCEKVSSNQIIAATGSFVLSYGIGAILGPLVAPLAMSWFGVEGLFYFLALTSFSLYLISFADRNRKKSSNL